MQLSLEIRRLLLIAVAKTIRVYYLSGLVNVRAVQVRPDRRLVLLDHAADVAQVELLHLLRLHVDRLLVLLDAQHGAAAVKRAELGGICSVEREEHCRVDEVLGLVEVRINVSRHDVDSVPLGGLHVFQLLLLGCMMRKMTYVSNCH